jgi:hypothetical protein
VVGVNALFWLGAVASVVPPLEYTCVQELPQSVEAYTTSVSLSDALVRLQYATSNVICAVLSEEKLRLMVRISSLVLAALMPLLLYQAHDPVLLKPPTVVFLSQIFPSAPASIMAQPAGRNGKDWNPSTSGRDCPLPTETTEVAEAVQPFKAVPITV